MLLNCLTKPVSGEQRFCLPDTGMGDPARNRRMNTRRSKQKMTGLLLKLLYFQKG
jgi:hypothetical protein